MGELLVGRLLPPPPVPLDLSVKTAKEVAAMVAAADATVPNRLGRRRRYRLLEAGIVVVVPGAGGVQALVQSRDD